MIRYYAERSEEDPRGEWVKAEIAVKLLAALEESLQWHLGDKWRFSKIKGEREVWERRHKKLEALIAEAKGEEV